MYSSDDVKPNLSSESPPAAPSLTPGARPAHQSSAQILLWDRLPVVRLPASLKKTMLHYDCLAADATPAFLRTHFRKTDIPHPCLGLEVGGRQSSASDTASAKGNAARGRGTPLVTAASAAGGGADFVRARPPASWSDARGNALFLLEAAASGLGGETFGDLVGLPLLPLADGSLGRFLAPPVSGDGEAAVPAAGSTHGDRATNTIFVCSRAERRLLAGAGLGGKGGGAGHRLLEDLGALSQATKTLLGNKRVHAATNVAVMEPRDLAGMLDAVFPEAWKGLRLVAWAPGSRDVSMVLQSVLGVCGRCACARKLCCWACGEETCGAVVLAWR